MQTRRRTPGKRASSARRESASSGSSTCSTDRALFLLRRMIVSKTESERRKALEELFPFMKDDVKKTMEVMDGLPVTFRFLDPPLHEFVPTRQDERQRLATDLGITPEEFSKRADDL